MPAPRSILIDIHDRKLNPRDAHAALDASGRIKRSTPARTEDPNPEPEAETPPETPAAAGSLDLASANDVAKGPEDVKGAGSVKREEPHKEATVATKPKPTKPVSAKPTKPAGEA